MEIYTSYVTLLSFLLPPSITFLFPFPLPLSISLSILAGIQLNQRQPTSLQPQTITTSYPANHISTGSNSPKPSQALAAAKLSAGV